MQESFRHCNAHRFGSLEVYDQFESGGCLHRHMWTWTGPQEAQADAQAYNVEARQCLKRLSSELTGVRSTTA
jgi:hypothetical protein